jgi:redox-sensitive bicupin YhaK (pirin superfamily)
MMNDINQSSEWQGKVRELDHLTSGVPASDGDGVRLTRIIGSPKLNMVDPFLLLDSFESDQPNDYIGGFPDHPHRGFETVTYLLAGRMRHKDNAGHEGVIETGGVQWMTAGRGIVHSEMPEQENGLLQGFQLWVNLPASDKFTAPTYQEFKALDIPVEILSSGGTIRVISGKTDKGTLGLIKNKLTEPLFLDVSLNQNSTFEQNIISTHAGIIYIIEGTVLIGTEHTVLSKQMLGVLGKGDKVKIFSKDKNSRFLLIAGKRLNEPVARGGPFVMNTRQEVQQAFLDFEQGRF